jgi:hypothetical protein
MLAYSPYITKFLLWLLYMQFFYFVINCNSCVSVSLKYGGMNVVTYLNNVLLNIVM